MKIIVTHLNPDLDAICSAWLIKKFLPGWNEARVEFIPQGETFNNQPVDSNKNVLHVDTGLGKLDHHQEDGDTCAAKKTWQYIKHLTFNSKQINAEVIDRMVVIANDIDHFGEVYWPETENDRYEFFIERIFDGWKLKYPNEDRRVMEWGFDCLDGIYQTMLTKVKAEEELKKGQEFMTKWGKGIGVETVNDEVVKLAQRKGFKIALRKDPRKGYVRIKTLPDKKIDLTKVYQKLKKLDSEATWYLHPGKNMLLNGSTHNPKMRSTSLKLEEIIKIIKST